MKTRKWKYITEDIEEIKEAIVKVKNSHIQESDKNNKIDPLPKGSGSMPFGLKNFN